MIARLLSKWKQKGSKPEFVHLRDTDPSQDIDAVYKNFLISVFRANPNITPNPAWTMFQLQFPPTTNETTISKGYPTKKKVST